METHFLLELLGYTASGLIVIATMMSSILWLRMINMVGAAGFCVYGLLMHAYPVAFLNSFVVVVNICYVTRMLRAKRFFQLLKLKPDSDYLNYFLGFYRRDITSILPDFDYRPVANQVTLFILRDCVPVGVFIAEQKSDGVLRVILDFVIPGYRDLKIGKFLFVDQAEFFRERGIQEIIIAPRTKKFGAYLLKVGFEPASRPQGSFRIRYADKAD
jgi:hypothetical protein